MAPEQRFRTRGSRTPGCPKQDFQGTEMQFQSASLYVLGWTFFKGAEIYDRLQALLLKRTISILIIPANVLINNPNC